MNEEIKFDLDKDIIMQIEMDSYMKYNDTIASMNDHLGEIYGYSDVKDMEETQLKYEKKLAYKAIKDLQQKVEQLEKEVNEYQKELEKADSITQSCIFQGKQESKISFRNCLNRLEQLENIRKESIGYVTSYESISTIQGLDDIEKNKNLDEKTMNEMINRYLKVHDILLNILNKGSDKE